MHAGSRLTDLIASGPLPTDRLLEVCTALAEAVETLHAHGQAVGGLTPATVFVPEGGGARPLDAAWVPISARRADDLLALGALLYAMATGVAPYGEARIEQAPPSPIERNPRLPSGLVQLIRRAVHPDAAERFTAAGELRDALHEIRRAPSSLESLLPAEHVSSTAGVKPPPRPAPGEDEDEDETYDLFADVDDDVDAENEEPERGLPPR